MIKIGDTVINKVQKSEGGVETEIPIVQTNDGTLLHLGFNTYKTEFRNNVLQRDVPIDGSMPLSRHQRTGYDIAQSNFIRARLFSNTNITSTPTETEMTIRFTFASGYIDDQKNARGGIEIWMQYQPIYYSEKDIVSDMTATIRWVGDTKAINYIHNEVKYADLRGLVAELWINGDMRPCYRIIGLGYNQAAGKYTAYSDTNDVIVSQTPLKYSNLNPLTAWISNTYAKNEKIKREIEIASYKPADFSNYEEDYYLQNMSTAADSIKGKSSSGTLISGRYTPLEGNSSAPSGSSGSSSGSGSSGGNPSIDETIEIN